MALTCDAAETTPRDVVVYQRKETDQRRVSVLLALQKGAATIDEIIDRIGTHISRILLYHYDKATNYSCLGHIEGSETTESKYAYAEIRRTLISLEKKGIVDRFEAERPPHLWFIVKPL